MKTIVYLVLFLIFGIIVFATVLQGQEPLVNPSKPTKSIPHIKHSHMDLFKDEKVILKAAPDSVANDEKLILQPLKPVVLNNHLELKLGQLNLDQELIARQMELVELINTARDISKDLEVGLRYEILNSDKVVNAREELKEISQLLIERNERYVLDLE